MMAAALTLLCMAGSSVAPASAEDKICDIAEMPSLPDGCYRELVRGSQVGFRENRAKNNAEEAWQKQVVSRFGRRFSDFKKACKPKLPWYECERLAGLSGKWGWFSCIVAAYPCSVNEPVQSRWILLGERTIEAGMLPHDIINISQTEEWYRDR
jgi:hypothetical protein